MSKRRREVIDVDGGPSLHTARWRFNGHELDETRRELRRGDELLNIEPKPLNLLMLFVRQPNEMVTKNELIDAIWPGGAVDETALGNCVAKLRKALGPEGAAMVKNVFGFGYRFDAVVEHLNPDTLTLPPTLELKPGDVVPGNTSWQLLRRLGRAGDSWLARHRRSGEQNVFKFSNDPRALVALKREVAIFRLLSGSLEGPRCHVELVEWNFDAPPWYLQAEFCPGGSLLDWLTEIGGPARLSLSVRIELLARIADAVAAVHQVGVMHKDLKPGNVMIVPIDGIHVCPDVRLGDFGSGRVLDGNRLSLLGITRVGVSESAATGDSTSGTPMYYAPERLAGQSPTIKADIYALGVMLYQLVVGDLNAVFAPGWDRDIDDALLKEDIGAAAEGKPEQRLADAGELARRLRALPARRAAVIAARQAQDAVESERLAERQRIDAAERAVERMRARRTGQRLAIAALFAGSILSTMLYFDARRSRDVAQAAAARSDAVSRYLVKDIFESIDPTRQSVRELSVKELLDSASLAMAARFGKDPPLEAELRRSLGRSYMSLGFEREATRELERALDLFEASGTAGAAAAVQTGADLVTNKYAIGEMAAFQPKVEALAVKAAAMLDPANPELLRLTLEIARADYLSGRWQRSADRLGALLAAIPTDMPDRELFAGSVESLYALSLADLAIYPEAEKRLRKVLASRVQQFGRDSMRAARNRMQLGITLLDAGKLDEAAVELGEAKRVAQKWINDAGGEMLVIRWNEGRLLAALGDHAAAEEVLVSAIADCERLAQSCASQSGSMRQSLATVYKYQERHGDAERELRQALRDSTAFLSADHPGTQAIRIDLGFVLAAVGKIADAVGQIDRIQQARLGDLPKSHPLIKEFESLKMLVSQKNLYSVEALDTSQISNDPR